MTIETKQTNNENVYSPNHYKLKGLDIESIDVLRAVLSHEEFIGFCRGNTLKYLIRAGKKDNYVQDLEKAHVYLQWTIQELMKGGE